VILLLVIESYLIKFSFCKPSKSYSYGEYSGEIDSILFQEKYGNHRMVEIIFMRESNSQNMIDCFLYGDKELADNAISKRPRPPQVRYVSSKKLSYWVNKCSQLLIGKMRNGKIQNYSDKHFLQENYYDKDFHEDNYYDQDFPQEFNNEIDRNFFDGLMVCIDYLTKLKIRLTIRPGFARTVPIADKSLTGILKCPVSQNLSKKIFYLQI